MNRSTLGCLGTGSTGLSTDNWPLEAMPLTRSDHPARTHLDERGLRVGDDFHLAFSPERVDPGRRDWTTKNTPKIVGGITQACTDRAVELYSRALDTVHPVSSPEASRCGVWSSWTVPSSVVSGFLRSWAAMERNCSRTRTACSAVVRTPVAPFP